MSVVTRFINSSATTHQKAPNCNMWLTPLLITDMYPQQLDNMGHSSHNKVTTVDKSSQKRCKKTTLCTFRKGRVHEVQPHIQIAELRMFSCCALENSNEESWPKYLMLSAHPRKSERALSSSFHQVITLSFALFILLSEHGRNAYIEASLLCHYEKM